MTRDEHRMAELEHALYALLSAAQQTGSGQDEVRLLAIGGLKVGGSWGWLRDEHVAGAIDEIQNAAAVVERTRRPRLAGDAKRLKA